MQANPNYELKEVFDYKAYLEYMESKKVRYGKDRTYTLLDFVTEEQRQTDKDKGIIDLSSYDPTPKEINEHFKFVSKTLKELLSIYPNDKYLHSLENEEKMQTEYCSTDWYKKYGIDKK
jgi:hypothetical protein